MRIISKFKDYYDHAAGYGVDTEIVYIRDTKVIDKKERSLFDLTLGNIEIEVVIGFCGKLYPAICVDREFFYSPHLRHENAITQKVFWHFDEMEPYFSWSYRWNTHQKHLTEFKYNYLNKIFIEYNVPIFISYVISSRLVLNPMLKNWDFMRMVDPWTAFQEIASYISGVLLGPTKSIPDISDETMASIKGFDKWSFRKEPNSDKK